MFGGLSHVLSPFWSRNMNPGIYLFDEEELRRVRDFHLFAAWACIHVPWTHGDFFMAWDGNLVPFLYCVQLNVVLY